MIRTGLVLLLLVPATAHAEDDAPPLSIYGFARLDVLADDSRMSDIDQPRFVTREPTTGRTDGEFTMTPRLSQVGIGIEQWDVAPHITGEGKLEIDFGGGGGVNAIRLRHAYAALMYRDKVELLAGQTWDLISPLFPSAQNDTQLLDAGNTGDRRPQLRLSVFPTDHLRVATAVAVSGVVDQQDLDHVGQPDGMASGSPMLQWLIEYRFRWHGIGRVGVWGHVAREELGDGTRHGSSSVGTHVSVPVTRRVTVLGEGYFGENAADIGGGIGQGVDPVTGRRIQGLGGWLEAATMPTAKVMLALGVSGDTARARDIEVGDRETNTTGYGVLRYKPRPSIQLGLEYLHWVTTYKEMGRGVANRFDFHLSCFF